MFNKAGGVYDMVNYFFILIYIDVQRQTSSSKLSVNNLHDETKRNRSLTFDLTCNKIIHQCILAHSTLQTLDTSCIPFKLEALSISLHRRTSLLKEAFMLKHLEEVVLENVIFKHVHIRGNLGSVTSEASRYACCEGSEVKL